MAIAAVAAIMLTIVNTASYRGENPKWVVFLGYLALETALAVCIYFLVFLGFVWLFWID